MDRRSFLSSLAAVSAIFSPSTWLKTRIRKPLPTTCDLSFRSLQWAIDEGVNFGRPLKLVVGPENLFTARELLGVPKETYWAKDDPTVRCLYDHMLTYEVTNAVPQDYWELQFERGTVFSDWGISRG